MEGVTGATPNCSRPLVALVRERMRRIFQRLGYEILNDLLGTCTHGLFTTLQLCALAVLREQRIGYEEKMRWFRCVLSHAAGFPLALLYSWKSEWSESVSCCAQYSHDEYGRQNLLNFVDIL